eukprot:8437739-Lingulodinium_polyedra.AAC.1
MGLIKGRSASVEPAKLRDVCWDLEADLSSFGWSERVPSPSNPSDGPSRLCFSMPVLAGAARRQAPPLPA